MRLLFVLGTYFPYASANGVCVSRVQEALYNQGVISDVIAEGKTESVSDTKYGKLYSLPLVNTQMMCKLQRILAALRYPLYFPQNIWRYRKMIDFALSRSSYDAIIAVLRPLDGALATTCYSNMLIYELDSVTNNDDNEHGFRRFLRHRTWWMERFIYKRANFIFHMDSHKAFYGQKRYGQFSEKSAFLDIPQLVNEKLEDWASNGKDRIRLLYSGILDKRMRSPEYAITLLKEFNRQGQVKLILDFYSRGNCEEILEKAQQETGGTIQKRGYVSLDVLNAAVAEADCLLSIGNSLTGKVTSLPSKVISYMAYGKPILHLDGGSNDVAKVYLARYPLALVIDPTVPLEDNTRLMHSFFESSLGKRATFEEVKRIFEKNTPEFTAEQIIRTVSASCKGTVTKR